MNHIEWFHSPFSRNLRTAAFYCHAHHKKNASYPPKPIIADVLYYSGLIEQWGRGIALMFDECKRVNAPAPRINDDGFIVRVVFPRPDLTGTRTMSTVAGNEHSKEHSNGKNDISRSIVDSENDISRSKVDVENDISRGVVEVQSEYSNTPSRTVHPQKGGSRGEVESSKGLNKGEVVCQDSIIRGEVGNQKGLSRGEVVYDIEPSKASLRRLILLTGNDIISANEIQDRLGLKSRNRIRENYIKPAIEEGFLKLENPNSPTAPNQRYRLTDKGLAYYYKHRNE